jgi:hypothetical protein
MIKGLIGSDYLFDLWFATIKFGPCTPLILVEHDLQLGAFWGTTPNSGKSASWKMEWSNFYGFGTNSYLSWYIGLGGRYDFGKGIYLDVDLLYMFNPEGQVAKLITSIFQIGFAMVKKILGYSSV